MRLKSIGILALTLILAGTCAFGSSEPTAYNSQSFKTGSKTVTLKYVQVDMNRTDVKANVVLGWDKLGNVEALGSMANRFGATAAINGNFFAAYEGDAARNFPYGMVKRGGVIEHIGSEKTCIGIGPDNKVKLTVLNPLIKGTTNGTEEWPNNWYSYWINRPVPASGDNVVILTPTFGQWTGENSGTSVVVTNGVVTAVRSGNTQIPANGYVINLLGVERDNLIDRFSIGTPVDYRIDLHPADGDTAFWDSAVSILGVGPRLVANGAVACNPAAEGYTEAKIATASGARSAIGITWDNKLIMATGSGTVYELAEAMRQLGCKDAMNLDGGGSSALWYKGAYKTGPGRNLATGLVITYNTAAPAPVVVEKPITVALNGKSLNLDVPPVVKEGRTLAPARGILEGLGWSMGWDAQSRTVTATRGDDVIEMVIDSKSARVNGEAVSLDVPAQVVNGRTLVPLRFIGESTGSTVRWDGDSRKVIIEHSADASETASLGSSGN